jgi:hypothetical protein
VANNAGVRDLIRHLVGQLMVSTLCLAYLRRCPLVSSHKSEETAKVCYPIVCLLLRVYFLLNSTCPSNLGSLRGSLGEAPIRFSFPPSRLVFAYNKIRSAS